MPELTRLHFFPFPNSSSSFPSVAHGATASLVQCPCFCFLLLRPFFPSMFRTRVSAAAMANTAPLLAQFLAAAVVAQGGSYVQALLSTTQGKRLHS